MLGAFPHPGEFQRPRVYFLSAGVGETFRCEFVTISRELGSICVISPSRRGQRDRGGSKTVTAEEEGECSERLAS